MSARWIKRGAVLLGLLLFGGIQADILAGITPVDGRVDIAAGVAVAAALALLIT